VLTGCGTTIVKGSGENFIATDSIRSDGWEKPMALVVEKADEHCKKFGKKYVEINRNGTERWDLGPVKNIELVFQCGQDTNALIKISQDKLDQELKVEEFNPIKDKIELSKLFTDASVPFQIASNQNYPTEEEKKLIAKWIQLREAYYKRNEPILANSIQVGLSPYVLSAQNKAIKVINELINALYQQKITYGEFAKKRAQVIEEWKSLILDGNSRIRNTKLTQEIISQEARSLDRWSQQFTTRWFAYLENINSNQPNNLTTVIQASADSQSPATNSKKPLYSTTRRIALVIGNSNYLNAPLRNPVNDASDISAALKQSGFEVIDQRNATFIEMTRAVREFGDKLLNSDVGLVYFSGHGIEAKGRNYLLPINATMLREDEIAFQAIDANLILEKMNTANKSVNILIVDACRDNPFTRSFRGVNKGLAQMDAPSGTIVSFSTSPGKVAADGDGRNSPFTKNLVKSMKRPDIPIETIFKEVRKSVVEETKGQQTPWESSSLIGDFFFKTTK